MEANEGQAVTDEQLLGLRQSAVPKPVLGIGRILHYRLSKYDIEAIHRRRNDAGPILKQGKFPGVQMHVGNSHDVGQIVPLLVVRIWPNEFGDRPGVNGQAFLDGNDTLWITSAGESESEEPGTWSWPERK